LINKVNHRIVIVSVPTLDISATITHTIFVVNIQKTQGNYTAYAALGFSKHLGGDVDGAIVSYHEALSQKPEDPEQKNLRN
jgi:hypothetical protein